MTDSPAETDARAMAAHLGALVASGALAGPDADTARDLAARLVAPVRVALLARQGAPQAQQLRTALRAPALALHDAALPDDRGALCRALSRLSDSADIAIWYGAGFGPAEAAAWAQVPDRLKDHSLLAIAPDIAARDKTAMQGTAGADFAQVIDLAHGPEPLRDAVLALARAGRDALVDAADVLLLRAAMPALLTPSNPATPEPDTPRPTDTPAAGAQPPGAVHCADLAVYLAQRGADLLPLAARPRAVLDSCLAACEAVAESLVSTPEADPALVADATDAADRILLIAMEDGAGAAADAVAILLQLRRDYECRAGL
jgi:hypothetical protein